MLNRGLSSKPRSGDRLVDVKTFLPYQVITILIACILLCNCNMKDTDIEKKSLNEIMQTDRAFSEISRRHGMKKAFIEFIDNNGVLLRPNRYPIIGAEAIDYLTQTNDSSFSLTWKPAGGEVSSSGDLGFTYGVYALILKDSTINGTYVSIWKKQKDGNWKFVLDSGNEGLAK